jgi:hypothetical protein
MRSCNGNTSYWAIRGVRCIVNAAGGPSAWRSLQRGCNNLPHRFTQASPVAAHASRRSSMGNESISKSLRARDPLGVSGLPWDCSAPEPPAQAGIRPAGASAASSRQRSRGRAVLRGRRHAAGRRWARGAAWQQAGRHRVAQAKQGCLRRAQLHGTLHWSRIRQSAFSNGMYGVGGFRAVCSAAFLWHGRLPGSKLCLRTLASHTGLLARRHTNRQA